MTRTNDEGKGTRDLTKWQVRGAGVLGEQKATGHGDFLALILSLRTVI